MKRRLLWLRIALVALALLFIWGNSMLPGPLSSRVSRAAHALVEPIAKPLEERLAVRGYTVDPDILIRKTAHVAEFLVLGLLLYLLLLRPDGRGRPVLTAGLCLLAALLDEGIQMFTEARGPSLTDAALDLAGACAGALLAACLAALIRVLRRKRE